MRFQLFALMLSLLAGSMNAENARSQTHLPEIAHSGNEFLEVCKHTDEYDPRYSVDSYLCLGFVEGFVQGIYVSDEFRNLPLDRGMTCPPAGISNLQFTHIIRKHIEEHPERAHMLTRNLASEALMQAFPCKK